LGYLNAIRIDPDISIPRYRLIWNFAFLGLEKEALAITADQFPSPLSLLGKHGDAVAAAEASFEERPSDLVYRRDLGLALASAGDYARAQPILEEMWRRSGGLVTRSGLFQSASAAALITIRSDAGNEVGVGELVAAIRDNVRRYHEAGITHYAGMTEVNMFYGVDFEDGLAAYLAGERERGLELISKAEENGFFIPLKEAYLQSLYDDPGFAPIHSSQKARQVREREKFLAIVCTDNPYAAVWQPAEGTCERYAEAANN
jgi:hypothetical protein